MDLPFSVHKTGSDLEASFFISNANWGQPHSSSETVPWSIINFRKCSKLLSPPVESTLSMRPTSKWSADKHTGGRNLLSITRRADKLLVGGMVQQTPSQTYY